MTYPPPPGWNDPSRPNPQPGPSPTQPTNGLAIAALILSVAGFATCVTGPVGAILGHLAMRQIRERGESGAGLAKAAIIVGWIVTGLLAALIIIYVIVLVVAINSDTI